MFLARAADNSRKTPRCGHASTSMLSWQTNSLYSKRSKLRITHQEFSHLALGKFQDQGVGAVDSLLAYAHQDRREPPRHSLRLQQTQAGDGGGTVTIVGLLSNECVERCCSHLGQPCKRPLRRSPPRCGPSHRASRPQRQGRSLSRPFSGLPRDRDLHMERSQN